jgi:PST family polysaccharide transporter
MPAAAATVRDSRALDRSIVHSVAWRGGAKLTVQVLSWVATLAVARLLAPTDYGLMSMAGILVGAIQVFSDFGIGSTVVVLRELPQRSLAQLNGLAVLVGSSACAMSMATAPLVARFFESPRLVSIVTASSLAFLVTSFRVVPTALLTRDMHFKRLAVIEAGASVVQMVTLVSGALMGLGVWALVAGPLVAQSLTSVVVCAHRPVAVSRPRRADLLGSMTFTRHQLTVSLLWYLCSSSDFLIAAKMLGEKSLGVYYVAWNLSKAVPEKVAGLIVAVVPAYFSAIQDDVAELRRYLLRLTEVMALVTFPALVGIALLADLIEADLLGGRWTGLAGPLRILALQSVLSSIAQLPVRVLTVRRDTRFLVRTDLVLTATLIPAFLVGSHWGPTGIAIAWIAVAPAFQLIVMRRTCGAIGLPGRRYFGALWPAASMTVAMAVTVALVRSVGTMAGPVRLPAAVCVGACAYAAAGWILHRDRLLALSRAIRRRQTTPAVVTPVAESAARP